MRADTRAVAEIQNAKVAEALGAFADLRGKLVERSASQPGMATLEFGAEGGATLDIEDLDRVERLLSEAKGIHEAI